MKVFLGTVALIWLATMISLGLGALWILGAVLLNG